MSLNCKQLACGQIRSLVLGYPVAHTVRSMRGNQREADSKGPTWTEEAEMPWEAELSVTHGYKLRGGCLYQCTLGQIIVLGRRVNPDSLEY